ncbi:hypothetical protein BGX28_006382 [Mortierella sp. GBA30]|nr:hypothetical protein BGX28_006382 [Mortierella sp. GBA30]
MELNLMYQCYMMLTVQKSSREWFIYMKQLRSFQGNGTFGTFTVTYYDGLSNFALLTMSGLNNMVNETKSYVLYCDQAPENTALQTLGVDTTLPKFKVPVSNVTVKGTFTSSYVELGGLRNAIKVLENPGNVVSPCLQEMVQNGSIAALSSTDFNQYETIDVGFNPYNQGPTKDVWIPASIEVDPLLRIEYIRVVSLFFNQGSKGEQQYQTIKNSYNTMASDMDRIPAANKKRIAWVKYDFTTKVWRLRNSQFVRGIITAAGGVPFPLNGDVGDDTSISADDIKTIVLNAQIIIDQTDFTGQSTSTSQFALWRTLAGFTVNAPSFVYKLYTLNKAINMQGISDYLYRSASRPDLLLKDVIHAQYPEYDSSYKFTFLNYAFPYGTRPEGGEPLNATMCATSDYDIVNAAVSKPSFAGDSSPPPPVTGGGIYGNGSSTGGGKKTGIIVAVVCVAAVLGAGFAFAFFKWSKRAKEDRFIELEEEMNNEIPLH